MKDLLYLLRRLHGLYARAIRHSAQKKYLSVGNAVYIIGSPTHTNLGDSAIFIAEYQFVKKCGISENRIREITYQEYYQDRELIKKLLPNKSPLFGLGGGNMGNQWANEEYFRYKFFDDFPDSPVIIFPQTVYFVKKEAVNQDIEKSVSYYNNRTDLTLVAREKMSEEIMHQLYPDTDVLLTPDIVLSATTEQFGVKPQERRGVMFCVRSDAEKAVDDSSWAMLEECLDNSGKQHYRTDMHSDTPVTKENRAECVRKKMQEFRGAELAITDRLHGMIFAAITGTPCVVFSNYNHKVKGTYEWIKYLPYIRYVETVEEAEAAIPELLKMKDCQYDNSPLEPYFDKLAEVVREKCQR